MLGQYRFFSKVPVSVLQPRFLRFQVPVPRFRFQLLDARVLVQGFQGITCISFILALASLVPFRYHFGSKLGGTLSFGIGT